MKQIASNLVDGAFRWIKQFAEKLPIPKITKTNQNIANSIIALVDKILEQKACHTERSEVSLKNSKKDSTFDTSDLESQIDNLVYQLYNLSNEEIEIIENKE